MKKRIITTIVLVIVAGLVYVGISTGILTGKVLPALGKVAKAVPPKLWVGLLFKLLVLTGLMGYITKLVNAKKERFLNGEIEYKLESDYVLVVGYDFQTKPLIKRLLSGDGNVNFWVKQVRKLLGLPPQKCVLLITDRDVRTIRADMRTELTKEECSRLLYMRRDLALPSAYAGLRIRGAKEIYVMGDEGMPGRDGIVLRACEMIAGHACSEARICGEGSIKVHVHLADPGVYAQMRSQPMSMDCRDKNGEVLFELDIFNYYDSWVWKCWSQRESVDESDPNAPEPYLPLRYKSDAKRVELFVIGSGTAVRAIVDSAITLLNYGEDSRCCRLTVVTERVSEVLPPDDAIAEFPELEIVGEYSLRDLNRQVAAKMTEAANDEKCAVTIVIAEDAPEQAVKTYLGLPFSLRCQGVSVLLWMGSQSRNLPAKKLIKVSEDRTQLRYFGMLNCIPWLDGDRYAGVVAINYYWTVCGSPDWPRIVSDDGKFPEDGDGGLVIAAKKIWNESKACEEWQKTDRWAKWSNINSAGSCKEKAALINGRKLESVLLRQLLKAEHNRWWSERLLADWRYAKVRDNGRRQHPNMIPFEDLDSKTQDIDKINIAVMARQGYIG